MKIPDWMKTEFRFKLKNHWNVWFSRYDRYIIVIGVQMLSGGEYGRAPWLTTYELTLLNFSIGLDVTSFPRNPSYGIYPLKKQLGAELNDT